MTSWRTIAAKKKADQLALIPKEWTLKLDDITQQVEVDVSSIPDTCGLLDAKEIQITNSDLADLLEKLAAGEWSSVSVTTAFYKRAIIAHQLTNCLTEIFIERALARAASLDDHLQKTGTVVGPLHGLPVSLKDQINIKGLESCMGYVSWVGIFADKNSVLTDILENAGAVIFVKTNIPQTLMWAETFNHVFGRTSNPFNRSLTSGGSSGGEGALVGELLTTCFTNSDEDVLKHETAMRGSPLGVGSDIGGSIRIPAAFCGTYGLRPSYGRVPYAGCMNSLEGQDSAPSVLGPLSNSIAGIKTFMKTVIDARPWLKDPLAVRKRWSDDEYNLADHGNGQNLCFAIMWDDGMIVPHPPIIRGLEIVKKALLDAGHKVIDWKPSKHAEMYKCLGDIWTAGAAEDFSVVTAMTGEPVIASMIPDDEIPVVDVEDKHQSVDAVAPGLSAYRLWQTHKKKRTLREEYLQLWEDTAGMTGTGRAVDAIISPAAPYTAVRHGQNKSAQYTMVWSVLDYSTLVIPVSRVDPAIDMVKAPHEFYNEEDKANYNIYNPANFANAPISVQLVGRTLEEEAVIAMGEIVDNALKRAQVIETQRNV
ncbi:amidase signature domain-containing protein [Lentinula boryana]|uniref:Amidase signature domain-containing protein n=1 Tax=Lentinula boryana TaxID=40481 RepID=A0ABQ8QJD1_9AGAR|nr:amidase signature domain-containing protein [Lentinula boryana]